MRKLFGARHLLKFITNIYQKNLSIDFTVLITFHGFLLSTSTIFNHNTFLFTSYFLKSIRLAILCTDFSFSLVLTYILIPSIFHTKNYVYIIFVHTLRWPIFQDSFAATFSAKTDKMRSSLWLQTAWPKQPFFG